MKWRHETGIVSHLGHSKWRAENQKVSGSLDQGRFSIHCETEYFSCGNESSLSVYPLCPLRKSQAIENWFGQWKPRQQTYNMAGEALVLGEGKQRSSTSPIVMWCHHKVGLRLWNLIFSQSTWFSLSGSFLVKKDGGIIVGNILVLYTWQKKSCFP